MAAKVGRDLGEHQRRDVGHALADIQRAGHARLPRPRNLRLHDRDVGGRDADVGRLESTNVIIY